MTQMVIFTPSLVYIFREQIRDGCRFFGAPDYSMVRRAKRERPVRTLFPNPRLCLNRLVISDSNELNFSTSATEDVILDEIG